MNKYSDFNIETFSMRLKDFREDRKMTQTDLAKAIDTTTASISAYEHGLRDPKCEVYCKLADALFIDPIEFFVNEPTSKILQAGDNIINLAQSLGENNETGEKAKLIASITRRLPSLADDDLEAIAQIVLSLSKSK